jgi:adenylate cyclase class 2
LSWQLPTTDGAQAIGGIGLTARLQTFMPIEIEKKYRLTNKQREQVLRRLPEIGAKRKGEEFEVNTLYAGDALDLGRSVLRLRRIGKRGILTYKERFPTRSGIKHQREDETRVADPDAMELILEALGFTRALVYEKRRETWSLGETEIVVDELPFGLFMEIEGSEQSIRDVESKLAIKRLRTEMATYPQLTLKHGKDCAGVIESRFPTKVGQPLGVRRPGGALASARH